MYFLYAVYVDCRVDIPMLSVGLWGHRSHVGAEESRGAGLVVSRLCSSRSRMCLPKATSEDYGKEIDSSSDVLDTFIRKVLLSSNSHSAYNQLKDSTRLTLTPPFSFLGGFWGGRFAQTATRFPGSTSIFQPCPKTNQHQKAKDSLSDSCHV
jgi:hypothetical protein